MRIEGIVVRAAAVAVALLCVAVSPTVGRDIQAAPPMGPSCMFEACSVCTCTETSIDCSALSEPLVAMPCFQPSTKVTSITLAGNIIAAIPPGAFAVFPALTTLVMAGNPSVCSVGAGGAISCFCARGLSGDGSFCLATSCEGQPPLKQYYSFQCGGSTTSSICAATCTNRVTRNAAIYICGTNGAWSLLQGESDLDCTAVPSTVEMSVIEQNLIVTSLKDVVFELIEKNMRLSLTEMDSSIDLSAERLNEQAASISQLARSLSNLQTQLNLQQTTLSQSMDRSSSQLQVQITAETSARASATATLQTQILQAQSSINNVGNSVAVAQTSINSVASNLAAVSAAQSLIAADVSQLRSLYQTQVPALISTHDRMIACWRSGMVFVGVTAGNPSGCDSMGAIASAVNCTAETRGVIKLDNVFGTLICDGSTFVRTYSPPDGSSAAKLAFSCSALRENYPSKPTGLYWIQSALVACVMDPAGPYQVDDGSKPSANNPTSCIQLGDLYPNAANGLYFLRLGSSDVRVWCQKRADGLWWTPVLKLAANDFCYYSGNWRSLAPVREDLMLDGNFAALDAKAQTFYLLGSVTQLAVQTDRGAMTLSFERASTPLTLMTTNTVRFIDYPDYQTWRSLFGQDRNDGPVFMRNGEVVDYDAGATRNKPSCRRLNPAATPVGCGQRCVFCYQASDTTGCTQDWLQTGGPDCCNMNANTNDVSSGMGLSSSYCGGGDGSVCSLKGSWSTLANRVIVWAR